MSKNKQRVLSGIRATGQLHLGNYFGAIKGMLALQDDPKFETFYMVADAHSITTPYQVESLRSSRLEVILDYLAVGLDPQRSVLFLQSAVPQHFELAFYFSSLVSMAKMQHLPTFKDKIKQHPENVTMALLSYPVLMAADILLYQANQVPVGVDQKPHIEVAREIARKCNNLYGTEFPLPNFFNISGEYIPSLSGEGKMSKSVEGSYINLSDDLATIEKKIAKIPTDSGKGEVRELEAESDSHQDMVYFDASGQESKGIKTLMILVELFAGSTLRKEYEASYQKQGLRYADIKKNLAKLIFDELLPIQEKRAKLAQKSDYVKTVIEDGNQKARDEAEKTIIEVKEKIGLSAIF
jgi:tryptophanyl-tRNA synthetase